MDELLRAGLATTAISTGLALVAAFAARRWRKDDAVLWHRIYSTIMAAALVAPLGGPLLPGIRIAWHTGETAGPFWPGPLTGVLVSVYAIGLAVMAARLVSGLAAVRRLRRDSQPLDGPWHQRLSAIAGADRDRCCWHAQVRAPLTAGWLAPLVVLPQAARQWPAARLHAVLRHELAHVHRHDYALNLIAAVQVAVYWPSPAAWWLARQARLAAEVACDRAAAAAVGEAEYARVLVQSAREFVADGYGSGLVAPGADTDLFRRIEVLIAASPPVTPLRGAAARWLLAALVGVMLMAGAIRVAPIAGPRPAVDPGLHVIRLSPAHHGR